MGRSYKFWDRIAKYYSKQPVADEAAYQKKLEISRGYFEPAMTVLEFGCGTGTTAISHAPYVKYIDATDVSEKMLQIARDKAAAKNIKNVTFAQSNIEDAPVEAEKYDIIMGHSILHLLEDRDAAIAKIYAMLKPGGIFISSTVCLGSGHKILKAILPIGKFLGLLPSVKFITKDELENSITHAGFTIDHLWQPKEGSAFIVAKKRP